MKWKPIETAPKNGETVLFYSKRNGVIVGLISKYMAHYKKPMALIYGTGKATLVTHWMPLPEPPNE